MNKMLIMKDLRDGAKMGALLVDTKPDEAIL
jgi:hypothetical protein